MRRIRSLVILILVLTILVSGLFNIFWAVPVQASLGQRICDNIDGIDDNRYPGIRSMINQLRAQQPNWRFRILYTNLDWNHVIANQFVGHNASPRNLVPVGANWGGQWICPICGNRTFDNGNWRCASEHAIGYMMDPRNSLNTSDIFQFSQLSYRGHDINIINGMINGTFLQGQASAIINAAQQHQVNPYYIIARILQEQGRNGTALSNGNGWQGEFVGFFNPFNIGAWGNSTDQIMRNGLSHAQRQGWNSLQAGIAGGISFVAREYINRGQDTLYFQKFAVVDNGGLFWRQYMQNLLAAQSEGTRLRQAYIDAGAFSGEQIFVIPVYENMPRNPIIRPNPHGTTNLTGDVVRVDVNSAINLRSAPAGAVIGTLTRDEIVTRIERATTRVNGTFWDRVRRANGQEGFVARETALNETPFRLYLVPVGTQEQQPPSTRVKIEENTNTIIVSPAAIAQDILDAFGTTNVKITRANGSLLSGPSELMGTGFIVEERFTVVKKGDATGDGLVNISDMLALQRHLLGVTSLYGSPFGRAVDLDGNGILNISDMLALQRHLLGVALIEI